MKLKSNWIMFIMVLFAGIFVVTSITEARGGGCGRGYGYGRGYSGNSGYSEGYGMGFGGTRTTYLNLTEEQEDGIKQIKDDYFLEYDYDDISYNEMRDMHDAMWEEMEGVLTEDQIDSLDEWYAGRCGYGPFGYMSDFYE